MWQTGARNTGSLAGRRRVSKGSIPTKEGTDRRCADVLAKVKWLSFCKAETKTETGHALATPITFRQRAILFCFALGPGKGHNS